MSEPLPSGGTPVSLRLAGTPAHIYVVAGVAEWLEVVYTANADKLADWELNPPDQRQIGQP
ncbi:hypothetical protein [Yoonia sp.]|uniref:hypothetical protein n=1 Tax=Yoonia sp. TaxID=2212373 RepID=UPI003A4D5752